MWKVYSIQLKFPGKLCFSGQAQIDQNSWMWKGDSIQLKILGQLFFQGKRKLLKYPEWYEIHIQYSEIFQGHCVFQGKRQLLKNPEW